MSDTEFGPVTARQQTDGNRGDHSQSVELCDDEGSSALATLLKGGLKLRPVPASPALDFDVFPQQFPAGDF
jgi:hypothetical protein